MCVCVCIERERERAPVHTHTHKANLPLDASSYHRRVDFLSANVLNKKSSEDSKADKGWFFGLWVGRRTNSTII